MVTKGSVAVDGVSLTVVDVTRHQFRVAPIPHTLSHSTFGSRLSSSKTAHVLARCAA